MSAFVQRLLHFLVFACVLESLGCAVIYWGTLRGWECPNFKEGGDGLNMLTVGIANVSKHEVDIKLFCIRSKVRIVSCAQTDRCTDKQTGNSEGIL